MNTDTKETGSTELAIVQTTLTEFDKISAGLAELSAKYGQVVFPVTTAAGLDEAKKARQEIRAPRYATENARKAAKSKILALGKNVDERAAQITAAITALEDPIHAQIVGEEERKEAERAARQKAEQDRLAKIQGEIDAIKDYATNAIGKSAIDIDLALLDLRGYAITKDLFFEFVDIAEAAKVATLARLVEMRDVALAQESAAAKLKHEQEELRRRQAEQEERERQERDRLAQEAAQREAEDRARREALAAEEAAAKARIEAAEATARKATEEADRARQEAWRAEEARRQAERDEQERRVKAEADRLAKERQAKEERERKAQEAKDAKAKAKAEREEEARQKALQKEMQRSDARQLLRTFSGRYADVPEFHEILVAIDVYFQAHPEVIKQ